MAYPAAVQEAWQAELAGIREKGIYKEERFIHSPQAARHHGGVPERRGAARRSINLCSNNYLGLSSHPEVVAAAHAALDERGYGMSSVRFICGTQDMHRELEQKLTEFLGTEDTILFPSCLDANAGVFEAILGARGRDDLATGWSTPASSTASACARRCTTPTSTADMAHLEQKLQEHQDKRVRVIITDGVFSMDGDLAPLDEICALAEKYDALVFVDDSHAIGLHRQDRPRRARALRRDGQDRHHHDDARQGAGRGERRLRVGPQGDRRAVPAEGAAVPVQQRGAAADRLRRRIKVLEILSATHRAARQARGEREVLAQGRSRRPASSSRTARARSSR